MADSGFRGDSVVAVVELSGGVVVGMLNILDVWYRGAVQRFRIWWVEIVKGRGDCWFGVAGAWCIYYSHATAHDFAKPQIVAPGPSSD